MKQMYNVIAAGMVSLFLAPITNYAQGSNITAWQLNETGETAQYYASNGTTVIDIADSVGILNVCYNTDSVYIRTHMLAEYIMGPWPGDPFVCAAQDKSYTFPRNPVYPSSNHPTKAIGAQGILVNGVVLYDDEDGRSYKASTGTVPLSGGDGVWDQLAYVGHISEMDAGNAHPDPNQTYHNHHNPIQLCSVTSSTTHSPIIGFAFDGNPIYGPFGYSVATNSSSSITRMTSSWYLRNITVRTHLYDGTDVADGPAVSTTFPLGQFVQDYGYSAGSGDLDYYGGRYCVTPEYPNGTYAYFLNTDSNGDPQYPNSVGPQYYGSIHMDNFGPNGGNADQLTGATCLESTNSTEEIGFNNIDVYPNPSNHLLTIQSEGINILVCTIIDMQGRVVMNSQNKTIDVSNLTNGSYNILVETDKGFKTLQFLKAP